MTDLEVTNLALSALGIDLIRALADPTKAARFATTYLPVARNVLLRSHHWRSLRKRARLLDVSWVTLTAYTLGQVLTEGEYFFVCTTAGTSGASEPTWPTSGTVTDGTVVWTFSETNFTDFAYQYALPADCLAPQKLFTELDYSCEGGKLFTDDAPDDTYGNPVLIYTRIPVSCSDLSDEMAAAVAYNLSIMLMPHLGGNTASLPMFVSQYELARSRAVAADSFGYRSEDALPQKWTEV